MKLGGIKVTRRYPKRIFEEIDQEISLQSSKERVLVFTKNGGDQYSPPAKIQRNQNITLKNEGSQWDNLSSIS